AHPDQAEGARREPAARGQVDGEVAGLRTEPDRDPPLADHGLDVGDVVVDRLELLGHLLSEDEITRWATLPKRVAGHLPVGLVDEAVQRFLRHDQITTKSSGSPTVASSEAQS